MGPRLRGDDERMADGPRCDPQLRHPPPHRRRAGRLGRARSRPTTPRCWWRRRARARPRGCRWRCSMSRGSATKKSSCWSRGGSRRAPAPSGWRSTLGERVGDTVGYRVRFGSKVSRATRIEVVTEGIFSRQILDDPELTGIAAVLFDEFHERSLDADLGLALARDAQTGLREDLRILVMSATLDGARSQNCWAMRRWLPAKAALIRSRRAISAASPMRRWSGRWRMRSRWRCAPIRVRCWRSCRVRPKSAAPRIFSSERIHDAGIEIVPLFGALDAAVQDRAIAARAERTAQGGAGDLDRGDLADHRGRAHRGRFRRRPRAALRAGHRSDAAGNRARLARRGRSAPRPRRTHRARRLLPAVGRAADRVA